MNLETMRLTDAQRESIACVNAPLLLCAGAGSGKTFTLQQRIAYALSPESGPAAGSIDEILAITFTDKAAAEIKSRVRSVLRAEGMVEQALRVDAAWISTIHGMCGRILREHALELGIDPAFAMLDSDQEAELRTRAISAVLSRCDEEGGRFDELFAEYGASGSGKSVSALVSRLLTQAASLTGGLDAIEFLPRTFASPLRLADGILQACADALASEPTEAQRVALEYTAGLMGDFIQGAFADGGAQGEETWAVFADVLMRAQRPDLRGRKAKEAVREMLTALDVAFLEVNLARGGRLAAQLMDLTRLVEAEYERLKTSAGFIDMSGMLRLAMRALDEHPSIARQYRERFKLVMVDEFQDTNQLQIDMIERICGQGLPKLCTVGDSQQSIYRFLGADVNVYMKHKREMASPAVGAKCLELTKNFRSNPDVLAFVRRVCAQPGFFAEKFLDLEAGRDEDAVRAKGRHFKGEGARIRVQLTTYGQGSTRADAKFAEAEGIARWFSELRGAGHSPSEMVVLMGSTTYADAYARALREAGFSCVVAGGSGFFAAPEVKLAARALRALANPGDTEAVYALLSSEILALSADDFLLLATRWPSEGHEADVPKRCEIYDKLVSSKEIEGASPRLAHVAEVLRRAWSALGKEAPSRVLRALLVDSGYLDRKALEGVDGQAQVANVLKVVRMVEEIEGEVGFDMARVARKFEGLSAEKEKLGALAGEAADSVRLMTAHSSKGLEFPIVAVTDCYAASERAERLEMLVADGRAWASLLPSENEVPTPVSDANRYLKRMKNPEDELGECFARELARGSDGASRARILETRQTAAELRAALEAYRSEESLAEKRRLFYVAATRASEAMMVACTVKRSKAGLTLEPVQEDIAFGLFGRAGFPEADCQLEYEDGYRDESTGALSDRMWPLAFTLIDADAREECGQDEDAEPNPAVEGAEDAASTQDPSPDHASRVMDYPEFAPVLARSLCVLEEPGEGLFSYSSLASAEPTYGARRKAEGTRESLDADKATDFGLAFHRLAQLDALAGADAARGALARTARLFGLRDEKRLGDALERWLASEVRARAQAHRTVIPELSFCVEAAGPLWMEGAASDAADAAGNAGEGLTHLEGAMDLFCTNSEAAHDGSSAFVVDYKTGGSPAETLEELYEKHLLQARAYAFAAKAAGYETVELAFVRVEQPDFEDLTQPQVITYRF